MAVAARRTFYLLALLVVFATRNGPGQSWTRHQESGGRLSALIGGMSTLQYLNDAGTDSFIGGPFIAGSFRVPLGETLPDLYVGPDVAWTELTLSRPSAGSGTKVTFLFFGVDMAYTYLNLGRVTGDAFMGGGGVSVHPSDGSPSNKVRAFVKAGADISYAVSPKLQVFGQASVLAYRISNFAPTSVLGDYRAGQSHLGLGVGVVVRF